MRRIPISKRQDDAEEKRVGIRETKGGIISSVDKILFPGYFINITRIHDFKNMSAEGKLKDSSPLSYWSIWKVTKN